MQNQEVPGKLPDAQVPEVESQQVENISNTLQDLCAAGTGDDVVRMLLSMLYETIAGRQQVQNQEVARVLLRMLYETIAGRQQVQNKMVAKVLLRMLYERIAGRQQMQNQEVP